MKRMTLSGLFGKTAAPDRTCSCCGGTGEHDSGFECYTCDGGGSLYPGEDDSPCDGRYNDGGPSHDFGGLGPEGIMCVYPHPSGRRTAGEYHEPPMHFEGVKTWTQARQYGAEDRMSTQLPEHPIGSVEEAQKIADKVTNRAKVRPVAVQHTPGRNYSFAQAHPEHGTPRIVLGGRGMNHGTLLHELAHHIDRERGTQDPEEPHGDSFRGHFEQALVDHHPNSYVAREAFRDKFQQTDQVMRMGGRARYSSENPEMNEHEKAQPPVPAHKPMWEHNPETLERAENAVHFRNEPHTYRKYMHDYPELDFEHEDDHERLDAHMADEDLEKGLHPRLVPPHMLEAWVKHHPNPKALEVPEYDENDEEVPVRKQAAPAEESQYAPKPIGHPTEIGHTAEQGVHRGISVVLPPEIHRIVHDPQQPGPARAHLLLSELKKQRAKNEGPEGEEGTTGGLGNYWAPSLHKAAEIASQNGYTAYHEHEHEHGCGDEETGAGGCPTTQVIMHADTPPEEHHWHENMRPGEKYDPGVSWRLPVRPGTKMKVRGVSWREGQDHKPSADRHSEEGMRYHHTAPFTRYDFAHPVTKEAALTDGDDIPSRLLNPHGHHIKAIVGGYDNVELVPRQEVERYASQPTDGEHARAVGMHMAKHGMEPLILHYHPQSGEAYLGEGNHRLRAARHLQMDHVPVRVQRAAYGLDGPGIPTPQRHPAQETGGHVPAEIRPSDLGFTTLESPRHTAAVTFGPGADEHIGETEYDPDETWEHKGLWDRWHPQLQPTIHRHLAVEFPSGHPAHDKSASVEDRARAIVDHVSQKDGYGRQGKIGWHWTDDPDYKHLSTGNRVQPGQTRVILHAQTPPREHIEDADWVLQDQRAVRDWDTDPEREVPVKRNAPVNITGVSWDSHDGPQHHTFAEPITKRAGANGDLPEGLTFRHETVLDGRLHHMIAEHPDAPHQEQWGNHVGRITWWKGDGEVANLHVEPQYQRRGVATELWNRAKQIQPDLKHSEDQTEEGSAWARTTAAYVPPGTMGTDSQGHGVQMTTMDGWAHRDGSHGHEDGPDVGERPVYTEDHTWLPHGRYWGPNSAQNDQRLFSGDHLRPEVRQDVLDRIGVVLDKYGDWRKWARVYFAGSEAARWIPFNGDFDVLLTIDFPEFREEESWSEELEDAEIAHLLTEDLWQHANISDYYFTLADGRKVGPFDRTFYVIAAPDIRDIHPYAAYDVTDDDWAVHPLEVPSDWDARRLPESYWGYAEALLAEIRAIGQLPPEERHRMAANLYEELHTHRSDAFADGGHGLFDLSNIIEKFLDQHPDKPWDKLRQWKNESPSGPEPWVPTTARRTTLTTLFEPKTAAAGADYGGVMIALVPPKKICEKLAQEDGEPVEAMHVTLAYMPGLDRKKAGPELKELVEGWARTQKALTAHVGGVGTFVNPGQHVLWAAVDIPGGGPFRESLVETLERHGYSVANDHGWTPHITLDYRDHHVRFLPKVEPATWEATEIFVCVGDNWTAVPLG